MSKEIKIPQAIQDVYNKFESLKHIDENGREYWTAREVQEEIGYTEFRKFDKAINRGINAFESTGYVASDHIVTSAKMVQLGSGSEREISDYEMDRLGVYTVIQNCDSRKPEVGSAQLYFSAATNFAELVVENLQDAEQLTNRVGYKKAHKELSESATNVGVPNQNLGLFHDAGQRAMQGGLSVNEVKERKGLSAIENYPDHMSTLELTMNQMRMQMTNEVLKKGDIHGQKSAIETHAKIGGAIRNLVVSSGITPPEDMPLAESTAKIVHKFKQLDFTPKSID